MDKEKVKKLIDGVLEVEPEFWDNPIGAYTNICPFCYQRDFGKNKTMMDIDHGEGCAFLLAKELST